MLSSCVIIYCKLFGHIPVKYRLTILRFTRKLLLLLLSLSLLLLLLLLFRDVINPSIDGFPSFYNSPPAPSHKNPSYLFFRKNIYN